MGSQIKYNEIKQYMNKYNIDASVFIETGTSFGKTIFPLANKFKKLYTIELSSYHYNNAKLKAKKENIKNITFINGKSEEKLKETLSNNKSVIYLDAHYCGSTATDLNATMSNIQCPLIEELKQIIKYQTGECLIIIDDARLFGKTIKEADIDWTDITITNINNVIKTRMTNNIINNDRYIISLRELN